MPDPHVADQLQHVAGTKHVRNLAVILAQIQPIAVTNDNSGGVLATMLQYQQRIVYHLGDWPPAHYSDYSAHNCLPGV